MSRLQFEKNQARWCQAGDGRIDRYEEKDEQKKKKGCELQAEQQRQRGEWLPCLTSCALAVTTEASQRKQMGCSCFECNDGDVDDEVTSAVMLNGWQCWQAKEREREKFLLLSSKMKKERSATGVTVYGCLPYLWDMSCLLSFLYSFDSSSSPGAHYCCWQAKRWQQP